MSPISVPTDSTTLGTEMWSEEAKSDHDDEYNDHSNFFTDPFDLDKQDKNNSSDSDDEEPARTVVQPLALPPFKIPGPTRNKRKASKTIEEMTATESLRHMTETTTRQLSPSIFNVLSSSSSSSSVGKPPLAPVDSDNEDIFANHSKKRNKRKTKRYN